MRRASCGDNMIDTGEVCDDGDANADDVADASHAMRPGKLW